MNELISDVLIDRAESSSAPQLDPVALIGRARRRQRMLRGSGVIAVSCAVTAAALVGVIGVGPDPRPEIPTAAPVAPPAEPVPYYDGARLHLADSTVEVPRVSSFDIFGDMVVLTTQDGDEKLVGADGKVRSFDADVAYGPLVDAESGWAAWVEGRSIRGGQELVVRDLATDVEVARQELPTDGSRSGSLTDSAIPLAIEAGTVYYTAVDGDYAWMPGSGEPERIVTGDAEWLLDVQAGLRVYQDRSGNDWQTRVVGPGTDIEVDYDAGILSPDGRILQTGDATTGIVLIDVETGQLIDSGLGEERYVMRDVFGPDGTVTYSVGTRTQQDPDSGPVTFPIKGPVDLVTCYIATASCRTIATDVGDERLQDPFDVLLDSAS